MQKCQNKVRDLASAHAQEYPERLGSIAKELLPMAKSAHLYSVDQQVDSGRYVDVDEFSILWGDVSIASRPCS